MINITNMIYVSTENYLNYLDKQTKDDFNYEGNEDNKHSIYIYRIFKKRE
jgi:hypothetical protein